LNGFLTMPFRNLGVGLDLTRIIPLNGKGNCRRYSFGKDMLLKWGVNTGGDVYCAAQHNQSFLVLSGYILQVQDRPVLGNQMEAANILLRAIDEAASNDVIATILRSIYGSFGILYRSTLRDLTVCISDRVGSRPIWRGCEGTGWIVSSHPMAIAMTTGKASLDPVSVGAFLLYGAAIEPTHSLFSGVKAIPPGTIATLDARGIAKEYCWHRSAHHPNYARSLEEWTDVGCERLVRAARRLLKQSRKIGVFFSGGVDSRLAAAALMAAGGDPLLITVADRPNLEFRVASAAARALGLRHKIVLRDVHSYLRALPHAVYHSGGNYEFVHAHFSQAAAQVAEEFGIETFLLGDFCEAFSKLFCAADAPAERLWTAEEFAGNFDRLRLPAYRPIDRLATLSLLKSSIRSDIEQGLRLQISTRYQRLSSFSREPPAVGDYFARWESAPALPTFYMLLDLRTVAAERNLMFDPEVHELLLSLPSRMRVNGLGARMIHRLRPAAAWVPNSNTLLPLQMPQTAHRLSASVKPVLGRLRRLLTGDTHLTTGSWPKRSVLYVNDPAWREVFDGVFADLDLFGSHLFDLEVVARCWQDFIAGDQGRHSDIQKLVQLGLTMKLVDLGCNSFFSNFDLR
jgi:Asparagine synthase